MSQTLFLDHPAVASTRRSASFRLSALFYLVSILRSSIEFQPDCFLPRYILVLVGSAIEPARTPENVLGFTRDGDCCRKYHFTRWQ